MAKETCPYCGDDLEYGLPVCIPCADSGEVRDALAAKDSAIAELEQRNAELEKALRACAVWMYNKERRYTGSSFSVDKYVELAKQKAKETL